jgi:hypothetical protein
MFFEFFIRFRFFIFLVRFIVYCIPFYTINLISNSFSFLVSTIFKSLLFLPFLHLMSVINSKFYYVMPDFQFRSSIIFMINIILFVNHYLIYILNLNEQIIYIYLLIKYLMKLKFFSSL